MSTNQTQTYRSPSVPQVKVSGFWGPRIAAVRDKTADILYQRAEDAGSMKQIDTECEVPPYEPPFAKATRTMRRIFWDSDLGKIIETIGFIAANGRNPELEAKADGVIDLYEKLQMEDGYLNSWYIRYDLDNRWTNLRDCHEMYCAGHMLEGAVAYYQATGKEKFLNIMRRYLDHIMSVIGPEDGKRKGYPGHEELELALIKLYRLDGDKRYLDFAKYLVDERGKQPHYFEIEAKARGEKENLRPSKDHEYNQSHKPVREQEKIVGHAVRAMYLYCGMADVALETGDKTLRAALDKIWDDLVEKRMYVHGGMGPSAFNEGFTKDYDLPNLSAYAETCAAIGFAFWAIRMLAFEPNTRYSDMMELALYNGALSGISLDGSLFFYENPLESDGTHHRWEWHLCPCCPPNIARIIASIGTYFYTHTDSALAVHLYGESEGRFPMAAGEVRLAQKTRYPWDGLVEMKIGMDKPGKFALQLRIPGWAGSGTSLSVNGEKIDVSGAKLGYVTIEREWKDGDTVRLELPMSVRRVYANPNVRDDAGRAALKRGPLVYCLEGVDNPYLLNSLVLPEDVELKDEFESNLLEGVVTLKAKAKLEKNDGWDRVLYRETKPVVGDVDVKAVPYYAWDNRKAGEMLIWIRKS